MSERDDRKRDSRSREGSKRLREGARRGGEVVRQEFASALTRKRYCELVGIHPTTLRRWEAGGIVSPRREPVLGIVTTLFTSDDVAFGKALVKALAQYPGQLSLSDAAALVHGDRVASPSHPSRPAS